MVPRPELAGEDISGIGKSSAGNMCPFRKIGLS